MEITMPEGIWPAIWCAIGALISWLMFRRLSLVRLRLESGPIPFLEHRDVCWRESAWAALTLLLTGLSIVITGTVLFGGR
jgi:hypothetical protein